MGRIHRLHRRALRHSRRTRGGGSGNAQLTDEELEARLVVLREARAWMRGRYGADIDKVRPVSVELPPSTRNSKFEKKQTLMRFLLLPMVVAGLLCHGCHRT